MSAMAGQLGLFEAEHDDFRESVRRYLEGEAVPHRDEWMAAGVPREQFADLAELGFVAMGVPEAHGGAGIEDPRFGAVVIEEAMRAGLAGLAVMLSAHSDVCAPALVADGDQAAWLEGLASGSVVCAWADEAGELEGGALTGSAAGVVNGGLADVIVASARRDGADVVVAVDAAAASRTPSPELVGPKGCDRADLTFDDAACVVLDGVDAAGLRDRERLSLALAAAAGAHAALAVTLAYVTERRAFGQLIGSFENTRVTLAACSGEIAAAESLAHSCLGELAAGRMTSERVAAAKLAGGRALTRAADEGLQLHGGYGYMYDYEIAHVFGGSQFLRQHGGGDRALLETLARSLEL